MNLYRVRITGKRYLSHPVKAKNKVEAINKVLSNLDWRDKDSITNIEVVGDSGNKELAVEDYR